MVLSLLFAVYGAGRDELGSQSRVAFDSCMMRTFMKQHYHQDYH